MRRHSFTIRRALYAVTIWRWWPPVLWARTIRRGPYDPYGDMTWRTAWFVAGMVTQ